MSTHYDEIQAEFEKFFKAHDIDMSMSDFEPSDPEEEAGGLIQYISNEVEQHDEEEED